MMTRKLEIRAPDIAPSSVARYRDRIFDRRRRDPYPRRKDKQPTVCGDAELAVLARPISTREPLAAQEKVFAIIRDTAPPRASARSLSSSVRGVGNLSSDPTAAGGAPKLQACTVLP